MLWPEGDRRFALSREAANFSAENGARRSVMKFGMIVLAMSLSLPLVGCVEVASTKQAIGETAGSLTGGLIGSKPSQRAAPPTGATAALYLAWTTGDIGRRLDDGDRRLAAEAEFEALESDVGGTTREWNNASSGHRGTVTPGQPYAVNQYTCRDWVSAVTIDGRQETRRSTACRQPDGSWRPIS